MADNLRYYINGFPANVQDVFVEKFEFDKQIDRLAKGNLLYTRYLVVLSDPGHRHPP